MTQLGWVRNDLRLADNPALTAACQSGEPVRACFVVTPQQWQEHDWSAARVRFVLEHANALARELADLGVPLTFLNAERFSDGSDALLQFCKDSDIADVHFNEEYGINERRRDKALRDRLVAERSERRAHAEALADSDCPDDDCPDDIALGVGSEHPER